MLIYNEQEVNVTRFPDKTSQVWQLENFEYNGEIEWWFEGEHETFPFLQLIQLTNPNDITIPYFPYARQDKEVDNKLSFALDTFLSCLKSIYEGRDLKTVDIHNVEPFTRNFRVNNIYPKHLKKIVEEHDFVIFPDKGAKIRYEKMFDRGIMMGYCKKVRDQQSGYITHYNTFGLEDKIDGMSVVVVDDLCDGGATFNILAESLAKGKGKPEYLNLCVTHGIFSKGISGLLKNYDKIYTTDTLFHDIDWNTAAKQSPDYDLMKRTLGVRFNVLPCLEEKQ